MECLWYIRTGLGRAIELTIQDFYLEGDQCQYDYLAVYGGPDDSSPQLTRLCNRRSQNTTVTSQGNNMMLRFISDSAVEGKGFRASYRTTESKCGGLMTGARGVITSPNYPHNYDANDDCGWLITVDRDHVVWLTFEDFDVEPHSNCSYDHVAVYDGNSSSAPLLLVHCGQDLPSPSVYKSTTNQMFVRLKADGTVASKGFKADYNRGCGARIVTGGQGVMESPDWPHSWQDLGTTCDWIIAGASHTDRVTVTFTFLQLTNTSPANCSLAEAYVELRDGEDSRAPLLGRFCGSHSPPPLTTRGSSLYLHVNNVPLQAGNVARFRAVYTVEETACGGDLRSESGRVTSPGYPDSYPPAVECVWSLEASPGNQVGINFEMLDIEESENCNLDYVDIYRDGPDGDHLGRYCGSTRPTNLTGANKFWLKFNSDGQGSAPGFVLHYNLLHGSELSGESGEISSPLYPLHYSGETFTFTWRVTVAPGKRIEISFLEFDLEHGYQCYYSRLTIYDGQDDTGLELFRDCRAEATTRVVSSGARVFISLSGENTHYGVLFRLRWRELGAAALLTPAATNNTEEVPGCGGSIVLDPRGNISVLQSPGWPSQYSDNLHCSWVVESQPGTRVQLTIVHLSLEASHGGCRYDRLTVYDGMFGTQNWNKTGDYCRRNQRFILHSSGSNMKIVFTTDSSRTRQGFYLRLKSVCGGYLTSPRGVLTSPGYPAEYPANTDCAWTLRLRPATLLQFQLTDLDIAGGDTECSQDSLVLRNGERPTSPLFLLNPGQGSSQNGHLCGQEMPPVTNSSSNSLSVTFRSDGAGSGRGFQLKYSELTNGCGGRILLTSLAPQAHISSPGYPEAPPQHTECVWTVIAPHGEVIHMDVENLDVKPTYRYYYRKQESL